MKSADELRRQERWLDTYNASLSGLRSLGSMAGLPPTQHPHTAQDWITAQAEYFKEIATADADALHGPFDPDEDSFK